MRLALPRNCRIEVRGRVRFPAVSPGGGFAGWRILIEYYEKKRVWPVLTLRPDPIFLLLDHPATITAKATVSARIRDEPPPP